MLPTLALLVAIPPAPAAPEARPDRVVCELAPETEWAADAVSSVVCNGRPGFFAPRDLYRALTNPLTSDEYKLLESELALAKEEIAALRSAVDAGAKALALHQDAGRILERGLERSFEAIDALVKDVEEAAEVPWYERPILWFSIGGVVVGAVVIGIAFAVAELVPDSL